MPALFDISSFFCHFWPTVGTFSVLTKEMYAAFATADADERVLAKQTEVFALCLGSKRLAIVLLVIIYNYDIILWYYLWFLVVHIIFCWNDTMMIVKGLKFVIVLVLVLLLIVIAVDVQGLATTWTGFRKVRWFWAHEARWKRNFFQIWAGVVIFFVFVGIYSWGSSKNSTSGYLHVHRSANQLLLALDLNCLSKSAANCSNQIEVCS